MINNNKVVNWEQTNKQYTTKNNQRNLIDVHLLDEASCYIRVVSTRCCSPQTPKKQPSFFKMLKYFLNTSRRVVTVAVWLKTGSDRSLPAAAGSYWLNHLRRSSEKAPPETSDKPRHSISYTWYQSHTDRRKHTAKDDTEVFTTDQRRAKTSTTIHIFFYLKMCCNYGIS